MCNDEAYLPLVPPKFISTDFNHSNINSWEWIILMRYEFVL